MCLWSLRLFTLGFLSAVAMAGIIKISITESRIMGAAFSLFSKIIRLIYVILMLVIFCIAFNFNHGYILV